MRGCDVYLLRDKVRHVITSICPGSCLCAASTASHKIAKDETTSRTVRHAKWHRPQWLEGCPDGLKQRNGTSAGAVLPWLVSLPVAAGVYLAVTGGW